MNYLGFRWLGFLIFFLFARPCLADTVPCLSFQDLKALYPKGKAVFDFAWPAEKGIPHQEDLVEKCREDFSQYYRLTLSQKVPSSVEDKIVLFRILKNPDNGVTYLIFNVDPDHANDLMMVYFLNSNTGQLILKMRY